MKKRRRGDTVGGSTPSISTETTTKGMGAPPLSSNWLQLKATLGSKVAGAGKRKATETNKAPAASGDASNSGMKAFSLLPTSSDFSITRALALDCEMVGVGVEGKRNALARASLVNSWGNVVYDKHVRPPEAVTDFRTKVSGVRPRDLRKAEDFSTVQREVSELLKGRILVGHSLHNDLKVLLLSHPRKDVRDTQVYGPLRGNTGRPQALKHLVALHLGANIQEGEHDSVEDARAAMCLYQKFKNAWEEHIKSRRKSNKHARPEKAVHSIVNTLRRG